jgi:3-deoxy-D-manno-octulosonic-acid transferase
VERRAPGEAPVSVVAWPLDFPGATRRAFSLRRPRRLVVVETELWPNALYDAFERGARVAFVNARLSEKRWPRTRLLRPVLAPLLVRVSAVAAQTEDDRARWMELGVPREALAVTGNTKYDQPAPMPDASARAAARARLGIPGDRTVWTWGSLRPGEERALADAARLAPGATIVVAPRHPERAPAQRRVLEGLGAKLAAWTPGAPWPDGGAIAWAPELGILRELWEASDVATVGGTFAPYGGHSVAEPASRGVPVIVGPHHANARDVVDTLVARGAGRVAIDGREAADAFARWSADPAVLERARANAWQAVQDLSGASARTIGFLEARGFWG